MGGSGKRTADAAVEETVKQRKQGKEPFNTVTVEGNGPVLQVLSDYDLVMSNADAQRILLDIDAHADTSVKLILTGAGFLEYQRPDINSRRANLLSEKTLQGLTEFVRNETTDLVLALASKAKRDVVFGVDVTVGDDCRKSGQFAVVVRAGQPSATIVPKMLPVGSEDARLAGFGTSASRAAPHVVDTVLGRTLILVCHDAQCFNHLTIARAQNAVAKTPRLLAIQAMQEQFRKSGVVPFALNLIHSVAHTGNTKTFSTSHRQMVGDNAARKINDVIGAFCFKNAPRTNDLKAWANKLRHSHAPGAIAIVR